MNVVDVTNNRCSISLKKFSHLSLCQPYSFLLQADINLCLPVFCLINNDLSSSINYEFLVIIYGAKINNFQIYNVKNQQNAFHHILRLINRLNEPNVFI